MGCDTKILLTSAPSPLDLLNWADGQYSRAKLQTTRTGFYWLCFRDGEDERQLSVFPPGECSSDYADVFTGPATYLSMGAWGRSETIARRMCVHFGGAILVNDCAGDDWEFIRKVAE